jgi:hypothetical protein
MRLLVRREVPEQALPAVEPDPSMAVLLGHPMVQESFQELRHVAEGKPGRDGMRGPRWDGRHRLTVCVCA